MDSQKQAEAVEHALRGDRLPEMRRLGEQVGPAKFYGNSQQISARPVLALLA